MSVQDSNSLARFDGNGSTSIPYPVRFLFLEDTHLRVTVRQPDGSLRNLTLGEDFVAAGAGEPGGGNVYTQQAWPADYKLSIYRVVPATQLTSYVENSEFPAAAHERALDKLTMLAQQNERSVANSIRLPDYASGVAPVAAVANTVLGFEAEGKPTTFTAESLLSFLGATKQMVDQPTRSFLNAAARNGDTPEFLGQIGVQMDNSSLWVSSGTTAGAWQAVLGGTPYDNNAFIVAKTTASALDNGTALLAAYESARNLTPGGAPLSATNRACVIVPPGEYDLGGAELLLQYQYVDVVGMTTNRRIQYVHSATATTNAGVIHQTANDVIVQNLSLKNTCGASTPPNSNVSADYFCSSNLAGAKLKNVEFLSSNGNSGPFPMRLGITYSGAFEDCQALGAGAFGAGVGGVTVSGVAAGNFARCVGGQYAFGGNNGCSVTGTCVDCVGGAYAFGGYFGAVGSAAVLLNCRLTTGRFFDYALVPASGARMTNCHDDSGVVYFPTYPVGRGGVVQKVYAEYTGHTNLNAQIPLTSNVPTNRQGEEIMRATITPRYSDSKILISFQGFAVGGNMVVALFRDEVTEAMAASDAASVNGTASPCTLSLVHQDAPGTNSAISYRIRAGSSIMFFNGNASIKWFGAASKATLILEEIKA